MRARLRDRRQARLPLRVRSALVHERHDVHTEDLEVGGGARHEELHLVPVRQVEHEPRRDRVEGEDAPRAVLRVQCHLVDEALRQVLVAEDAEEVLVVCARANQESQSF